MVSARSASLVGDAFGCLPIRQDGAVFLLRLIDTRMWGALHRALLEPGVRTIRTVFG